jgi:hypothetical protein
MIFDKSIFIAVNSINNVLIEITAKKISLNFIM